MPISQRILICTLLFELRMLSKPSHRFVVLSSTATPFPDRRRRRPIWLARAIVWAASSTVGDTATLEPKKGIPAFEQSGIEVTSQTLAEASRTFDAVKFLYESVGTEADKLPKVRRLFSPFFETYSEGERADECCRRQLFRGEEARGGKAQGPDRVPLHPQSCATAVAPRASRCGA